MKTGEVDQSVCTGLFIRTEENSRGEDALEAFDDAAVMPAIFRQMKEIEEFRGRPEPDNIGLLAYCQRGNPNWDEAILPVGQSRIRMGDDVKEKFPVPPAMHLMSGGWTPERKPTENEWPRVEGKFLVAMRSLFADEADRVELLDLVLC